MDRRKLITSLAATAGLACTSIRPAFALTGQVNDPNENKQLSLRNPHNNETLTATFWRSGWFDYGALEDLNHFMRDWRKDEVTEIDPRLFESLHSVCSEVGYSKEIIMLSGYRTKATNDWLRRNPKYGAAKDSLHIKGKAIDFTLPGQAISNVRKAARKFHDGGIGYYPTQYFVHIDTGNSRSWVGR